METKKEIEKITMNYNMGFNTYNEYIHLIADATKNLELTKAILKSFDSDRADEIRREYHRMIDEMLMEDETINNILKDII